MIRDIRVLFIPYSEQVNPYQKLLAANLRECGVEVIGAKPSRLFPMLRNIFTHWRIDVVHLHWQHSFLSGRGWTDTTIKTLIFVIEIVCLKILGIKTVWTVHNLWYHEDERRDWELLFGTLTAHLCDSIIAHCEVARERIQNEFRLKQTGKIVVVPHGNYLSCYNNTISRDMARETLGLCGSDLVYLYFGSVRPYKGVLELIEAFQQLNVDDATLVIAGEPGDTRMARQIQERTQGGNNTRLFLRFTPDSEIQVFMNAADIIVLPYQDEDLFASGTVILAMSFGKAIIAPAVGCLPATVDRRGAFLYDPATNMGLVNSMREAARSRSILGQMGLYNLETAKKLRWSDIAKQTRALYDTCLGDR